MKGNQRRIAVVTGTRAEYGLLRWLMDDLRHEPGALLQTVVTGSHLMAVHGESWRAIEADGFLIDAKVDLGLAEDADSGVAVARALGVGTAGFADAFAGLRPDLVIVLGDRYEILAAAQAAMALRLPVCHIHGGEATEALWDEAIRHAVTKMSHLHCVAAEPFFDRVVQLGEQPDRVFVTGAPGLDAIRRLDLQARGELARSLGWDPGERFVVMTYHPVTLVDDDPGEAVSALFEALDQFPDVRVLATRPNVDAGGARANEALDACASARPDRVHVVASLGQLRYLSAVRAAGAVIGNSSSGIIEAPALGTPTVNIGERQRGRLRASSVIDCAETPDEIAAALRHALAMTCEPSSPYGDGDASRRIADLVTRHPLDGILLKSFFDLEVLSCASR